MKYVEIHFLNSLLLQDRVLLLSFYFDYNAWHNHKYNSSTLSGLMVSRFDSVSEDGFIKIETRMSLSLNWFMILLRKFLFSSQSHPK